MAELDPLYTADEMRAAESSYAGYPDSVPELMERAGGATALWGLHLLPNARVWTVVCGGGSNGGDGRVAARHLEAAGRQVRIVDAKAGESDLGEPDAIVDALFGTGFSGAPRPEAAALIERINAAGKPVLAVDLPSGVEAAETEHRLVRVELLGRVPWRGEQDNKYTAGHVLFVGASRGRPGGPSP